MKVFCKVFGYWLYHPQDTEIICRNRALKLGTPQCCSCLGVEPPESPPPPDPDPPSTNGDRELLAWIKQAGLAKVGRMLGDDGVDRRTVQKWVARGIIPNKYKELVDDLRNGDIFT